MAGVRRLTLDDVSGGLALSSASGWNQTDDDWRRALTVEGAVGWGIERDGRLVSTTTAIRYGHRLAWIGMVLTAESHRGQGLASQLMTVALDWLADCDTVKLDATDLGAPIYRRFGFLDEAPIVRYLGRPPVVNDVVSSATRGADAFEADRSSLLAALGTPACLADGSFAYGRAGRNAPFFGPCVADTASGERLLKWFAGQQSGEFMLDRMGNAPAGFRAARTLRRMYRGQAQPTNTRQYAIAGFEFG